MVATNPSTATARLGRDQDADRIGDSATDGLFVADATRPVAPSHRRFGGSFAAPARACEAAAHPDAAEYVWLARARVTQPVLSAQRSPVGTRSASGPPRTMRSVSSCIECAISPLLRDQPASQCAAIASRNTVLLAWSVRDDGAATSRWIAHCWSGAPPSDARHSAPARPAPDLSAQQSPAGAPSAHRPT
jgi:hypothetical protein